MQNDVIDVEGNLAFVGRLRPWGDKKKKKEELPTQTSSSISNPEAKIKEMSKIIKVLSNKIACLESKDGGNVLGTMQPPPINQNVPPLGKNPRPFRRPFNPTILTRSRNTEEPNIGTPEVTI